MTEQIIFNQLFLMPETLKQKALNYIFYLLNEQTYTVYKQGDNENIKKPTFGSAKGKYVLSPDFDEAIDDFKEYI